MSLSATLFAIFILFGTTILLWSGLYEVSYINLFGNIKPSIIGVLSLPIGMIVYLSIFFFIIDKVGVDFERSKFGIDVSPYCFLGLLGVCVLVAPISGFLMIQSKKEKTVQQLDKAAKVLNQDIKTILNFQEETYHKTGKLPEQIKDLDLNKDASKILSYTSIYNTFDLQIKPEGDHVFEKIKVIGKPGKASFECLSKNSGFCEQVFKPGLAFQPGVGEKGTCLKTIREKTSKDHLAKGTILSELTSEVECSNKVF